MTLALLEAQQALAAALQKAEALGIAVCVSVCDAGGRLVVFGRMDQSNWASIYGSQGKALTAAATRCRSGAIPPESVVMNRISELEGNNMIYSKGGVPLVRHGILLGAVGVGGASAELDEACALAAAQALSCDE